MVKKRETDNSLVTVTVLAVIAVLVLLVGGGGLVGERGVLLRDYYFGVSVFEDSVSSCDRAVLLVDC